VFGRVLSGVCPHAAVLVCLSIRGPLIIMIRTVPAQDPVAPAKATSSPPWHPQVSIEPENTENCNNLAERICHFFDHREFCDMHLMVGDESFPAHQVMLASMSPNFEKFLQQLRARTGSTNTSLQASDDAVGGLLTVMPEDPAPSATSDSAEAGAKEAFNMRNLKLRVHDVTFSEAVKILLSYIYRAGTGDESWVYNPSRVEVNKDVLHLARQLHLTYLHEHAARWLARGLTTKNCVERLVMCEEFGLHQLRNKIVEQLSENPIELHAVSSSEEVTMHPRILQALLMQVSMCRASAKPPAPERTAEKPAERSAAEKAASTTGVKPSKPAPGKAAADKAGEKSAEKPLTEKAADKPPAKRAKRAAGS